MTAGNKGTFHTQGRPRWLGIKEHVLKKGKMLWVERGLMGRAEPYNPRKVS